MDIHKVMDLLLQEKWAKGIFIHEGTSYIYDARRSPFVKAMDGAGKDVPVYQIVIARHKEKK